MSLDQGHARVRDVAEDALRKAFPESHSMKKSIRFPDDHLPQANVHWPYAASEDGKLCNLNSAPRRCSLVAQLVLCSRDENNIPILY